MLGIHGGDGTWAEAVVLAVAAELVAGPSAGIEAVAVAAVEYLAGAPEGVHLVAEAAVSLVAVPAEGQVVVPSVVVAVCSGDRIDHFQGLDRAVVDSAVDLVDRAEWDAVR